MSDHVMLVEGSDLAYAVSQALEAQGHGREAWGGALVRLFASPVMDGVHGWVRAELERGTPLPDIHYALVKLVPMVLQAPIVGLTDKEIAVRIVPPDTCALAKASGDWIVALTEAVMEAAR